MRLWRHPNSVWYVLHGPRLKQQLSTKTTDRRDAEKFLARFLAVSATPTAKRIAVGQILDGYYAAKKESVRSPESIRHAVIGLAPLRDLFPAQLTPPVIERWAVGRAASDGTVLKEVGVLRAALAWAVASQWLAELPKIANPVKIPQPKERWITKTEARTLLGACREPHMRVFITLALMTAARSGAILEARWDQVDWERRVLNFGRGHGNKRRAIVPINGELLLTLRGAKALACSDYIVEFRGQPVCHVKTGFAAACRRAGLADVTPHVLRHTAATWAVMDGIPLAQVARMLGDSEATVERVYAKHAPDYLCNAVGALELGTA